MPTLTTIEAFLWIEKMTMTKLSKILQSPYRLILKRLISTTIALSPIENKNSSIQLSKTTQLPFNQTLNISKPIIIEHFAMTKWDSTIRRRLIIRLLSDYNRTILMCYIISAAFLKKWVIIVFKTPLLASIRPSLRTKPTPQHTTHAVWFWIK